MAHIAQGILTVIGAGFGLFTVGCLAVLAVQLIAESCEERQAKRDAQDWNFEQARRREESEE
jgi:hypothetical protein